MAIFAIAKQYLPTVNVNFSVAPTELARGAKMVLPKEDISKEELRSIVNPANEDWLVFDNLCAAKLVVVMLSRLYSDNSPMVDSRIQQFASAVIFEFPGSVDIAKQAKIVDSDTLALYADVNTIPFYRFESTYSERAYCMKMLAAFKAEADMPLPRFRRYSLDLEPIEAHFQDSSGEFRVKLLQPAKVLPFKLCML